MALIIFWIVVAVGVLLNLAVLYGWVMEYMHQWMEAEDVTQWSRLVALAAVADVLMIISIIKVLS